ncbi:hypothetical protein CK203_023669 [Vitis vinifera]|uniref:Retrovirus-related Pol polyprotein from transposon RE1 n=1 Tax=Vitis vinifera TaxID=29760 RepID=A0A438JBM6_VITVI|nr:hypothetical protein CK203_023669 [Vitis vinifera]
MYAPNEDNMNTVMRILKYLKGSPEKGLLFAKNNHLEIEAYPDTNWASSASDRRTTSRHCTFIGVIGHVMGMHTTAPGLERSHEASLFPKSGIGLSQYIVSGEVQKIFRQQSFLPTLF